MTGRLLGVAWLLFIWLVLVGDVTVSTVLAGAAVSGGLHAFFRPTRTAAGALAFRPVQMAAFLAYFHLRFIEANLQVALAVIQPGRIRHRRAVVAVPIAAVTEVTTMVLANAVSLTPGTFILELRRDPAILYVHVLRLTTVRAARLSILELERRIVRAIGPEGAEGRVDALIAAVAAGDADGTEGGDRGPWTPSR